MSRSALAPLSLLLLAACGGEPLPPPAPSAPPAPTLAAPAPKECPPDTLADGHGGCAPTPAVTPAAPATAVASAAPPPPAAPSCPDGMALVPGGSFVFGLLKEKVTVAPFCMDVSETTADGYAACVKAGKCTTDFTDCAAQHTYGAAGLGDHPMVCVDFAQANAYCAAQSKRLATTEEWEWAARGGSEGHTYPWGNTAPKDQLCWSGATPTTGTCKVGSFPAGDNPQGIHDLAGNVFEWTVGKNDAKSPVRDGRGGSWRDGDPGLVKSNRVGGFAPAYRCGFLGIRCVVKAPDGAGK
jgi:formylglycine-generating enzyme